MNVYFAADHAGYSLKEVLKPFVVSLGYEVEDCGAEVLDAADDYPDFVLPCAKKVALDAGSFGVVIGASGQGEAMAANRVPGVRAAVYYGPVPHPQTDAGGEVLDLLSSMRVHNNANVLSLGARFLSEEAAKRAVATFLETPFPADERHVRRIGKLG
jgi:ribose 5-phosphate isomerase B